MGGLGDTHAKLSVEPSAIIWHLSRSIRNSGGRTILLTSIESSDRPPKKLELESDLVHEVAGEENALKVAKYVLANMKTGGELSLRYKSRNLLRFEDGGPFGLDTAIP